MIDINELEKIINEDYWLKILKQHKNLKEKQKDISKEFNNIVNKNFWDLI